ncbi:MAG: hypothetical protein MJZ95_06545 [Paludibacteraceae bacterium]|nr:hypothetical protein [Paludibacteraceae bacterium]
MYRMLYESLKKWHFSDVRKPLVLKLCHFIHPSVIDDEEKIKIHKEIQNLVHCNNFPNICSYLNSMADEKRILLPIDPNRAFSELHRMGMPGEENDGFSYKNFCKYYRK